LIQLHYQLYYYIHWKILDLKIDVCTKETKLFHFQRRILRIKTTSQDWFSYQFLVSIEYEDGEVTLDDETIIQGIKHKICHRELGIDSSFTKTQ
jgi:hypothetical protein